MMYILYYHYYLLKSKRVQYIFIIFRELDEKRNVKSRMVNSLKEDVAVQGRIDSLLKQITQFCEDFQKDYDLYQKYVRFNTF